MSKSSNGKITESAAASGSAKRLEEALDNLDRKALAWVHRCCGPC
jgi:hypothetical protein